MSKLSSLIREGASSGEVGAHLDALDDGPRVEELYQLGLSDQKQLWELASANAALTLESFAPTADQRVVYRGRNSLVAFQRFEKHFWRPADGGECFGFNNNPGIVEWFAGPGYFTFRAEDGLIVFDYTKVPTKQLPDWPTIDVNAKGFGPRVVYAGMLDYNRRVSDRVVIGEARKKGKPMGAYYVISRVDS